MTTTMTSVMAMISKKVMATVTDKSRAAATTTPYKASKGMAQRHRERIVQPAGERQHAASSARLGSATDMVKCTEEVSENDRSDLLNPSVVPSPSGAHSLRGTPGRRTVATTNARSMKSVVSELILRRERMYMSFHGLETMTQR